ncbi:T9SS type B sorting domain-containing protein [Wocania ichthyoenteri]|uniref:T9SS type B sorting domain-containing protein n=1 Tax=Wocania ichthyoenteri TaxID=1230531 RepID=UPI00053D9182|nr:choice-of-anchor L domain-containing protein [Wocania ichthyoenteri]
MKNFSLIAFIFCISVTGYGQIIKVNNAADAQSSFTIEKLVEDVLISSKCSTVDAFSSQVSGTPTQTTTKSYGYFKRPTGSTFPFGEGIILTTGQAFPAGNTINSARIDNVNSLTGDTDLQVALRQSNTFDATYVKFNFVPLVNTISFRFLMASEEYDGSTECSFADSFAFLLREVGTTNYQNLAVLPDGTPVSVKNINNAFACRANTTFFEGYNIPDTNYGGRTKVLTASAPVIPNTVYEIKIVVADQGDSEWDSAIFLEAGSFSIGGNLGVDRTIKSGNPGCGGKPLELDATLALLGTTYKWFKDGVEQTGKTEATFDVTTNGIYRVEIDVAAGCSSSDEIIVQFTTNPIIAAPPEDMVLCESDSDLKEVFDFSANQNLVLGSQAAADYPISFHINQTDAETNQNPIITPNAYTNTSQNETIWIRIADVTQTCFEVASFNIAVDKEAIANTPIDYELCDDASGGNDADGISTFDLSTKINEVLGSQLASDYEVKFYSSQAEADAAVSGTEITSSIQNNNNPQTIYARIENRVNTSCYDTANFKLVVNPLPVVKSIVNMNQCDSDTDGVTLFNLTEANSTISTDYLNETFTYYETKVQAEAGLPADEIVDFINYSNDVLNPFNDIVYARVETVNGCYRTTQINLTVGTSQIPAVGFDFTYYACDDKVDKGNTDGIASFDFSDADVQFRAAYPLSTVAYYINETDALTETNAIPDITDHRNDKSAGTQTIYVRIDSDTVNGCEGLGPHITLTVNPLPVLNTIDDYVLCSDTDFTVFDLPTKDIEVIGTQTKAILISYHLTEQDAIDNIAIANSSAYSNTSNPQPIFVRAQFDENGNGIRDADECYSTDMSFNLVVNHNPTIFQPDTIRICSDIIPTDYDLTIRESQITGGDASIILSYFETQLDLDNNKPIPYPTTYTNTLLDRDILVLATGSNTCTSITTLPLKIIIYEDLNQKPLPIEECEVDNNGFDFFDVTRRETEILNGLDTNDFEPFIYYENKADAIAGNSNTISNSISFENTQSYTQTIYARVKPHANECFIVVPINLIVNQSPEIGIDEEYVICLNRNDDVINPENTPLISVPPIDTQLNTTNYTFQWYNGTEAEVNADPTGTAITGATGAQYTPAVVGNYTVFATNITTGCRIPASTLVVGSYPPESMSVELLSTSFSDNNIIEVTVIGVGEYEYRLDSGSWQSSNVFERITGGEHTVYVRDLLNCNEISEMQIVIDYPKYFTPNNDGVHDTWNIKGIATQPNSEIYIFDRYGKLVKQLNPKGIGWDGTFNGQEFPTGDYWFIVKYNEPLDGTQKEFRSHFTLKR